MLVISLCLMLPTPMLSGKFGLDIDDDLRLIQIKDYLMDGNWFDRVLPQISMPEPYLSPWSRLVDLPYILFTKLLGLFMSQDSALLWATYVVPLLLLTALLAIIFKTARYFTRGIISPLSWIAIPLFGLFVLQEFMPGRIDHHNLQFLAMMMMVFGISQPKSGGGYLIGLSAVMSVAIGLEAVPFIATALATLAVFALKADGLSQEKIWRAGTVMAVLTVPASALLISRSELGQTYCDSLSFPWIAGLSGVGIIFTSIKFWPKDRTFWQRVIFLSLPLLILLIGLSLIFPQCLKGPYGLIGETERMFWLDNVVQEKTTFWLSGYESGARLFSFFLIALLSFTLLLIKFFNAREAMDSRYYIIIAICTTAFILAAAQIRYVKFFILFTLPIIPFVYTDLRARIKSHKKLYIPILGMFILAGTLHWVAPKRALPQDINLIMDTALCEDTDFDAALSPQNPGRIIAPLFLSMSLAKAELPDHPVAAIPFHRAAPGIRRTASLFGTNNNLDQKQALKPFTYLAICQSSINADLSASPLYEALMQDKEWPGLLDITPDRSSPFRIYRINHDAFQ